MYLFGLGFLCFQGKYLFEEPTYCFRVWLYQFTFLPTVQEGSPFSTSLPTPVVSCVFDFSHSDRCEVMPHSSFDLHFPDEE